MNKIYVWSILAISTAHATQLYIKNWGTVPVVISEVVAPETVGSKIIASSMNIQAGQSLPLSIEEKGIKYTNFNQITVNFNVDGYTKTEKIFFPDESTQEASLSFSESGYKRSPFNIMQKK